MANEQWLIDANELLKVLKHRVKGNEESGIVLGTNSTLEIMEEWVRSIPAVDAVEVVHGRWKPADDPVLYNIYGVAECSVCGYQYAGSNTNYCPNCGAKMDGGSDHAKT